MQRAVFLDRDGVIVCLVCHAAASHYEPPHTPEELAVCPGAVDALKRLQDAGYLLIVISNQPDHAKGKTSRASLDAVHAAFDAQMKRAGITFAAYYYCYHHPEAIEPSLRETCACRKPGTRFVEEAREEFSLDLSASWFVGDSDVDILCGKRMHLRTILIETPHSAHRRAGESPEYRVPGLPAAAAIICSHAIR